MFTAKMKYIRYEFNYSRRLLHTCARFLLGCYSLTQCSCFRSKFPKFTVAYLQVFKLQNTSLRSQSSNQNSVTLKNFWHSLQQSEDDNTSDMHSIGTFLKLASVEVWRWSLTLKLKSDVGIKSWSWHRKLFDWQWTYIMLELMMKFKVNVLFEVGMGCL